MEHSSDTIIKNFQLIFPPQNTSLEQLRQVQQPRYIQQQVHQQRLNNQHYNPAHQVLLLRKVITTRCR